MKTSAVWFFVAIVLPISSSYAAQYPDPVLTPGAVNPLLTKDVICSKTFRTSAYRKVSSSEKKKVFEEYGIDYSSHSLYEVDHFISLEIGGSNDIKNLWPQPYAHPDGAHEKDVVENFLHKEVCEDTITLGRAQQIIVQDWVGCYEAWATGGKCL